MSVDGRAGKPARRGYVPAKRTTYRGSRATTPRRAPSQTDRLIAQRRGHGAENWPKVLTPEQIGIRDADEANWYEQATLNGLTTPTPTPPGGRPRGGGGGGGGGGGKADTNMGAALQSILQSNAFADVARVDPRTPPERTPPGVRLPPAARNYDPERGQVDSAVSADTASSNAAYDQLAQSLGGYKNPYADMQVSKTPQISADLLNLLASQGTSGAGYEAQVGLQNAVGSQTDAAAETMRQRLTAVGADTNQSRQAETGMSRLFNQQELASQGASMRAALDTRQRDDQRVYDDRLWASQQAADERAYAAQVATDDRAYASQTAADTAQRTGQSQLDDRKLQLVLQWLTAQAENGGSVDVSQFGF